MNLAKINAPKYKKIAIAWLLLIPADIYAAQTKIQDNYIVEVVGKFHHVRTVAELPSSIYYTLINESSCKGIANPDQEFNSGCGVIEGRPCKKMLYAGQIGNIWFIEFRQEATQIFYAFRIIDEKIVSLVGYQALKRIKLTTKELASSLPNNTECAELDQFKYISEVKFGLCVPPEGSFYRRFLIENSDSATSTLGR